ncbi:MAG: CBS domain-containing protein [Methanobacteriaceae archaeon]
MTKNVITTSPDVDVVVAFEKLMKHKVSSLPVLDSNKKVIGIVTATDLGHNLILDNYKLGTSVESAMVVDVSCLSPDNTLTEAIKIMDADSHEGIINQLLVVENNELVGIISDGDIIKSINVSL